MTNEVAAPVDPGVSGPADTPWWRRPGVVGGGFAAAVFVPFVIAAAALRNPKPFVVLDLAQTELRVRGVFSAHPPLIGLPGRLGEFGVHTGSHPGPLSFWLLAPLYRLFGADGWAMFASALALNFFWVCLALYIGWRRGRLGMLVGVGTVVLLLVHTFGIFVVEQPWNPYMPLMAWTVVLLAAWAVLDDDHAMLPVLVFAASFCMQTHIPYLGMAGGVVAGTVVATVLWRILRARSVDRADTGTSPRERWFAGDPAGWPTLRRMWAWVGGSFLFGLVLWSLPIFDQFHSTHGNLTLIFEDITDPPQASGGFTQGLELVLQHLNVPQLLTGHRLFFVLTNPVWPGVVLLAVWVASAVVAWRLRMRSVLILDALVAWCLVLAIIALGGIYGDLYWYLMMWMWTICAAITASIVWVAIVAVRRSSLASEPRRMLRMASSGVLGIGLVALFVATTVDATRAEIPDRGLSEQMAAVIPPTVEAIRDGRVPGDTGEGRYLVNWNDPIRIGDAGYTLLNQLDAHGIAAGLRPYFLGIVPGWQTVPEDTERGVVHLSVGDADIEAWRNTPDAYEAVYHDGRSPAQIAEYERLRAEAMDLIEAAGGDPEVVDFPGKSSLDTSLPLAATQNLSRMSEIGVPIAVFLAPPGTRAAPR